jgi:radical SAM superfamily enzyme YgiQ (UPF0313 family)
LVSGEPEVGVPALIEALQRDYDLAEVPSLTYRERDGVRSNPAGQPLDLRSLPVPAYDLVAPQSYEYEVLGKPFAVLETSRGCPHHCSYCLKTMYGPTLRFKEKTQFEADLEEVARLGFRSVYFIDLEFATHPDRVVELCRVLRNYPLSWCCQTRVDSVTRSVLREMRRAGCRLIHYGIESGMASLRRRVRKGLRQRTIEQAVSWARNEGMATAGFFLIGLPGETADARRQTEALAWRLNLTYASFHMAVPYAGTELGRIEGCDGPWWENPNLWSNQRRLLAKAYLRYCLRPAYWSEYLQRGRHPWSALRLFLQFIRDLRQDP